MRVLETARLVLRRFTSADADNVYELDGDPEVMRYLSGGAGTPRHTIVDEILPAFCSYDARGLGTFAVEETSSGEFVGWASLRCDGDPETEASLGYRLRRSSWGRGYATELARALVAKGFGDWPLTRIVATTYEENVASRRVLEKAGLRLVGSYRPTADQLAAAGTFVVGGSAELFDGDDVIYAIDRSEWRG